MRKLILIILIIFSCSKEKNLPLGNDGNKVVETAIFQAEGTDFFYSIKKNTGASSHLLLGKYNDEYTAHVLLKFETFPDSAVIDSAQIILYSQNLLGDSSASFDAKMYKIESEWDENEIIDWNDLSVDSFNVLSYAEITPFSDDSAIFNLDPELVNQWIDTTLANDNYGVWINCNGASFIKDFYSGEVSTSSKKPTLRMVYTKNDQMDTTFSFPSKDVFVLTSNLNLDDNLLYIGKGLAFYSFLKFDVQSVIDSTATINKAELQLIINRDYSIFDASGVTDLRAMRITSESIEPKSITIDSVAAGYQASILIDTVTVEITNLIQVWTSNDPSYPNYGILLQSLRENQTLARTAFYSSHSDSAKVPKLVVTYTLPPSENYF